ncbi:hypothetical protein AWB78_07162 [Caballeronia calidae]|uniref:Uncharacterized protein n=1 Tax=Caballeronia calidae TaxID=1777139 RepID=A0A158EDP7_9BURK|nr:hypothetical protein [Caballeronia calidae]SAL04850.1 hypothetical protein AWB78_07162 [Caballeronia calidae]
MNDPDGRYASLSIRQRPCADGKPVSYLARRLLPDPERLTVLAYVPTQAGDRLDVFAARVLGDGDQWWRVADAHLLIHPEDLEEPVGRRLTVPLPEIGK